MSRSAVETRSRGLGIDRTACTGRGVCASLAPETIALDEWGYPIIAPVPVDRDTGGLVIRMCPARALRWQELRPGR